MNSSKLIQKICRICLGDKNLFNWNKEIFEFCGLTYKDCYYNYIQLEKSDSNLYPNQLCEMCGNELKNAHFLFERALESFYILRNCTNSKNLFTDYSDVDIRQIMPTREITPEMHQAKELSDNMDQTDNETNINSISYGSDNMATDTENHLNNYEEISISNIEEIDPGQFEELQSLDPSLEALWEPQLCQVSESGLSETKTAVSENSQEANLNFQSSPENSLDQHPSNECEPTNNQRPKTRKKYILICQYCSLQVNGTRQLKSHEATHNSNRERNHICTKCGLKFYTRRNLREHMKVHEENRQKKHKCEFCNKAFYNKGSLTLHRRIHLGLMLKCQICPKEFFRQTDLDRHLIAHSVSPLRKNSGLKPKKYVVQCQYCNKTVFTCKLKEHMAIHSNQPPVKCKICDKHFYSRTKCVRHLRRFHRKDKSEYDDFIHNFENGNNNRMSLLRIQQTAHVESITK